MLSYEHILMGGDRQPKHALSIIMWRKYYYTTTHYTYMPVQDNNHPQPSQQDLSVVLVTGSYDHEIRFWEAWSGICSRTIARNEAGVSFTPGSIFERCPDPRSSKSIVLPSHPSKQYSLWASVGISIFARASKRLLAAAIHKRILVYEVAGTSSTAVSLNTDGMLGPCKI